MGIRTGEHEGTLFTSFEERAIIETMSVHFEVEKEGKEGANLLPILVSIFGFIGAAFLIYLTRI